jgi:transcriptional regulator
VYIPELFNIADTSELVALMRARPFAMLISTGPGGLDATHLPTVLKMDGERPVSIECHVARANPQWKKFSGRSDALMIFGGPQGYIRPGWYPSKSVDGKAVPTWNYTVVHAHGRGTAIEDRVWLERHVRELTAQQEHDQPAPWAPDDAPRSYVEAMLRGIVGVSFEIARLEGKRKMSQNRTATDRAGVISGLRARGAGGDVELAELVERADRAVRFRSA